MRFFQMTVNWIGIGSPHKHRWAPSPDYLDDCSGRGYWGRDILESFVPSDAVDDDMVQTTWCVDSG